MLIDDDGDDGSGSDDDDGADEGDNHGDEDDKTNPNEHLSTCGCHPQELFSLAEALTWLALLHHDVRRFCSSPVCFILSVSIFLVPNS